MLPHWTLIVCSLVVSAFASARPSPPQSTTAESRRPGALDESFDALPVRFAENDRRRGWTKPECQRVGRGFAEVPVHHRRRAGRPLPEALLSRRLRSL